MFKGRSLGRNRSSARLGSSLPLRSVPYRILGPITSFVLFGLMFGSVCSAQSADTRSLDAYGNAVRQSVITARIQGMEEFLHLATNSSLKTDGLEFLIWDYLRTGSRAQSANYAQELLRLDPGNPLAIAARAEANSDAQAPPAT